MRCKDDSLYAGVSRNVRERIWQHNHSRRGAKSLKGKLPVKLVYTEEYTSINKALSREKEIKGWRKEKKEVLIN